VKKIRRGDIIEFTEKNGVTHAGIVKYIRSDDLIDITVFRDNCETYHREVPYSLDLKPLHWSYRMCDLKLGEAK
jgi:hypothetical protein